MVNLRNTYNRKLSANSQEEYYVDAWSIFGDEMTRLLDISWKYQKQGKPVLADKFNKAANQHSYLFYYALFMKNWVERQGGSEHMCSSDVIKCKYKIECVEKNLPCLSSTYNTDYVKVWEELKALFGIGLASEGCGDCCRGIGDMIIEDPDDCKAFIIGDCDAQKSKELVPPYGEFEQCEFVPTEVTLAVGNNLYDDCDDAVNTCNL